MSGQTFSERVLSEKSGRRAVAGEVVVCEPDLVLGTDGSTPMALTYFEAMGGGPVARPDRVLLARDHYAPPTTDSTRGFHERMERFAEQHGIELLRVGDGIGFLVAMESERVAAGDLVVGGDSHTVTCGALGALGIGVGSSDLAGILKTGRVWLRVPDTTRVHLLGRLPAGVTSKDLALELVARLRGRVGAFTTLEFSLEEDRALDADQRLVLSNMAAEMGAMAGVFPAAAHASPASARSVLETVTLDLGSLEPVVALPHDPGHRVPLREAIGRPVDWVFLGTCAGGRVEDFREARRALERAGGVADGVTLVASPPTARVREALDADGTLEALTSLGATVTETGCGPCCGTSGPIPPPGARVVSTANRNFRARMGESTAEITLASPAACAAAAAVGRIVDPREGT